MCATAAVVGRELAKNRDGTATYTRCRRVPSLWRGEEVLILLKGGLATYNIVSGLFLLSCSHFDDSPGGEVAATVLPQEGICPMRNGQRSMVNGQRLSIAPISTTF